MESMRISADYSMNSEECNEFNENTEDEDDTVSGLEHECYDQNGIAGKEYIPKTYSPIQELSISGRKMKKMHNINEELQDHIDTEINENSFGK